MVRFELGPDVSDDDGLPLGAPGGADLTFAVASGD
jgi:hypothetical protein